MTKTCLRSKLSTVTTLIGVVGMAALFLWFVASVVYQDWTQLFNPMLYFWISVRMLTAPGAWLCAILIAIGAYASRKE